MPRKLSSAAKELNGSYKKDPQRRNKHEPKSTKGKPRITKLAGQTKIGRAFWKATCELLDELGVLVLADVQILESYVLNEVHLQDSMQSIKDLGQMVESRDGSPKTNPACIEFHKCMDRRVKLMNELGLTPIARQRLVAVKPEEDPFADYMAMRGSLNN